MLPKVTLSICAIMKGEARYLVEWLEFHKLVGVQRFYLYENGDCSEVAGILQPYLESGEAILIEWPIAPGQRLAYEHCLQNYWQDSEWMAFIDLDEFLFPTAESDLKTVLQEFSAFAGVGVNWLMFGTSGHDTRPKGLQIEHFTKRAETNFPGNQHVKSIVQPNQVIRPLDPHLFVFKGNAITVTEKFLPLSSAMADCVSVEKLRVNHYFTRSREDMRQKLLRGRANGGAVRTWEFLESADRNEVEDRTIQRFLPQLKQAIAARSLTVPAQAVAIAELEVKGDSSLLWTGYLDSPQVNQLVYGSTLFICGWVIGKQPVVALQIATQIEVISEIPVAHQRPDVLAVYSFVTDTDLLGFRGTFHLDQILSEETVYLKAVFADGSSAPYGYLKVTRDLESAILNREKEVLHHESIR